MKRLFKLSKGVVGFTGLSVSSFYGYHTYLDVTKPEPYDFSKNKGKPKQIIIVGTGMVGLITACYLSNYEHNQITILEKNSLPY